MKFIATRGPSLASMSQLPKIIRFTKPVELKDLDATIVVDLPGPMIKISGTFPEGRELSREIFPDRILEVLEPDDLVIIGDAKVVLRFTGTSFIVLKGGHVEDEQVHVPGKDIPLEGPTKEDLRMIEFAKEIDAHAVLISMVRTPEDVLEYAKYLPPKVLKIAKIETLPAAEDMQAILSVADAAILARGDLYLNAYPERLFAYKLKLARLGLKMGKPYFAGTGYLKSLEKRFMPERTEVDDVTLALALGYDAILLTKETREFAPKAIERFERIVKRNSDLAARIVRKARKTFEVEVSSFSEALRMSVEAKLSGCMECIRCVGDERECAKARLLWGVIV